MHIQSILRRANDSDNSTRTRRVSFNTDRAPKGISKIDQVKGEWPGSLFRQPEKLARETRLRVPVFVGNFKRDRSPRQFQVNARPKLGRRLAMGYFTTKNIARPTKPSTSKPRKLRKAKPVVA
ncbi:hypothetical protein B0H11DRAFT_1918486 [Mycena galericulata]|nr:hypothetical protein B0H11DRAFT_1918486 [Mycena galericulata]